MGYSPYSLFSFPGNSFGESFLSHSRKVESPQNENVSERYGEEFSEDFENAEDCSSVRVYPWMRQQGETNCVKFKTSFLENY